MQSKYTQHMLTHGKQLISVQIGRSKEVRSFKQIFDCLNKADN